MGSLRTTSNCRALAAFNFGIGSFKPSRLKSCHLQSTNCKTSVNCRHSALCAWTNAGVRNKSRLVLIAGLYATVIPWAPFVSTNSLLPSTPPTKPAKRRTGRLWDLCRQKFCLHVTCHDNFRRQVHSGDIMDIDRQVVHPSSLGKLVRRGPKAKIRGHRSTGFLLCGFALHKLVLIVPLALGLSKFVSVPRASNVA